MTVLLADDADAVVVLDDDDAEESEFVAVAGDVDDGGQYLDPASWHIHILRLPNDEGRCVPCNKVFKRFQAARRHFLVMHTAPELFECCYCGQVLNKYAFCTHINSKHGVVGVKNVLELYGRRVN